MAKGLGIQYNKKLIYLKMQIFKSLKNFVSKSLGSSISPNFNYSFGNAFTWGNGSKNWQLTQGYRNIIVYSFVNVLVRKLIEAPVNCYKIKNEKAMTREKSINFTNETNIGRYLIAKERAYEELESHLLIDLLEKPNAYQTGIELREHFWFNYNLTGDGFYWVELPDAGRNINKPINLHSLTADRVIIIKNNVDFRTPVDYYLFTDWAGFQHKIDPKDMMHLTKWSPLDPGLGGFSPLIAGAKTISKNEANQIAQGMALQNGGTGIIISSDVGVNAATGKEYDKLTSEQVGNIKDTIAKDWAGYMNNQKIHVTNGKIEVNKLGDTLSDLKAIEAAESDWIAIGAIFGVDPILAGFNKASTDSNVEAKMKALVTNIVVSELRKYDEKFSRFMLPWYGSEKIVCKHDLTSFSELAADLKIMKAVYGDADFVTPNEKRVVFGYEKDDTTPGMNSYWMNSGKMTIDEMMTMDEPVTNAAKRFDYKD